MLTRIVLFLVALNVYSYSQENTSVGVFFGGNANFHQSNIPQVIRPGSYPIPAMNSGETLLGGHVGLGAIFPLSTDILLSAQIGYNVLSGSITGSSQFAQDTTISNKYDGSLSALEISPRLLFMNILPVQNLYLIGGFETGIPIKSDYVQTFAVNSVETAGTSSGIADAGFRFALQAGLGYYVKTGSVSITPELTFRFPFTKVSSNSNFDSWTVPQLRFGLGVSFDVSSNHEKVTPRDIIFDVKQPRVVYYTPSGDTADLKVVRVEDIQYSELYPLVPYIFFNEKSKNMDTVYKQPSKRETGDIDDISTLNDAVQVNGSILDVLCARMKKFESARLQIIGTNDGKKEASLKNLSRERAEQARDYLINCGISADRLSVSSRDLPEKASSTNDNDGISENRRVEFRSEIPEILEPVVSKQELERLAEPDMIEFQPQVASSEGIASWKLELSQAGRVLRELNGFGEPKPMRWAIRPSELSDKQVPVDYTYTVTNSRENTKTYNGSLPVEYFSSTRKKKEKLADRTIDKFSLILFDFDSDVLTPENQRILELKVLPSIKTNSIVKVYGYTDRIGQDKYNKELSSRRAKAVANALQSKAKDVKFEMFGFGETKELFSQELPTGRQLSRTVQIIVETPR